jgi:hypothetical protein
MDLMALMGGKGKDIVLPPGEQPMACAPLLFHHAN